MLESQLSHLTFVEIDLEVIFTFIFLPLIQEGKFLVTGGYMHKYWLTA